MWHCLIRALTTLAFLVVIAGCGEAPVRPAEQTHDIPPSWRNLHQADTNLGPAPDFRSWWRAFNDAELDRLVDLALRDNLTLAQAGYRVHAARELAWRTQASFLPNLSVHTIAIPNPTGTASYIQAGPDVAWEIGLFGLSHHSNEVAKGDIGLAEADRQAARVSLVAEVARIYVSMRSAQQRFLLLDQIVQMLQQKLKLTQTRVQQQLATTTELHRAEAELSQAQSMLIDPQSAITQAQHQLAVLLAQTEPDPALSIVATPPTLRDLRIEQTPADLLRTRPEIKRAEQAVLKSAGERGLAWADLFPKLTLHGLLTYSFIEGGKHVGDVDGIFSIGPSIDIPLFDWGQRRAALHAREDELAASLLAYRQAILEGIAETENALALNERLRQRVAQEQITIAALEQSDASMQAALRLGLADGINRADSASALLQAKLQLSQAQEAHSLAFILLYKALGGAPLPAPDAEQ
ncbi:efflux transporter outer membrane subunit [Pseudolysobacter antarcticus]|uniref:Efflux transporter outer membrane subunit n=1 Tax=Pseudolysobacter antarcticus TaxID=2511995 RepID=A0A411HLY2_9GAMM|nr:efflux transporter outer membrane subunit [Pseudolysobacter antarcticus]QBB71539.1 efflux transporter outer membrane subunit [Pseudolysobacter antarcticus]